MATLFRNGRRTNELRDAPPCADYGTRIELPVVVLDRYTGVYVPNVEPAMSVRMQTAKSWG